MNETVVFEKADKKNIYIINLVISDFHKSIQEAY